MSIYSSLERGFFYFRKIFRADSGTRVILNSMSVGVLTWNLAVGV